MAELSTVIPLVKVDAERRLVIGRAAMEQLDRSGEIMDYATAKPAFQSWSDTFHKATNGMSKGNVRVMHSKQVAGKLTEMTFNDADKAIDVVAHIADDNEWKKVQAGLYTGFSIGGGYAKRWEDGTAKRYTPNIMELSLVDLPCIPGAQFVELVKAGGLVEQLEIHPRQPLTFAEAWASRPLSFDEQLYEDALDAEAEEAARPLTFGEMEKRAQHAESRLARQGRYAATGSVLGTVGGTAAGLAASTLVHPRYAGAAMSIGGGVGGLAGAATGYYLGGRKKRVSKDVDDDEMGKRAGYGGSGLRLSDRQAQAVADEHERRASKNNAGYALGAAVLGDTLIGRKVVQRGIQTGIKRTRKMGIGLGHQAMSLGRRAASFLHKDADGEMEKNAAWDERKHRRDKGKFAPEVAGAALTGALSAPTARGLLHTGVVAAYNASRNARMSRRGRYGEPLYPDMDYFMDRFADRTMRHDGAQLQIGSSTSAKVKDAAMRVGDMARRNTVGRLSRPIGRLAGAAERILPHIANGIGGKVGLAATIAAGAGAGVASALRLQQEDRKKRGSDAYGAATAGDILRTALPISFAYGIGHGIGAVPAMFSQLGAIKLPPMAARAARYLPHGLGAGLALATAAHELPLLHAERVRRDEQRAEKAADGDMEKGIGGAIRFGMSRAVRAGGKIAANPRGFMRAAGADALHAARVTGSTMASKPYNSIRGTTAVAGLAGGAYAYAHRNDRPSVRKDAGDDEMGKGFGSAARTVLTGARRLAQTATTAAHMAGSTAASGLHDAATRAGHAAEGAKQRVRATAMRAQGMGQRAYAHAGANVRSAKTMAQAHGSQAYGAATRHAGAAIRTVQRHPGYAAGAAGAAGLGVGAAGAAYAMSGKKKDLSKDAGSNYGLVDEDTYNQGQQKHAAGAALAGVSGAAAVGSLIAGRRRVPSAVGGARRRIFNALAGAVHGFRKDAPGGALAKFDEAKHHRDHGKFSPGVVGGALGGAGGLTAVSGVFRRAKSLSHEQASHLVSSVLGGDAFAAGAAVRGAVKTLARNTLRTHGPAALLGAGLGAASAYRLNREDRGEHVNEATHVTGSAGDAARFLASPVEGYLKGNLLGAGLSAAAQLALHRRRGLPLTGISNPFKSGLARTMGGGNALWSLADTNVRIREERNRRQKLEANA